MPRKPKSNTPDNTEPDDQGQLEAERRVDDMMDPSDDEQLVPKGAPEVSGATAANNDRETAGASEAPDKATIDPDEDPIIDRAVDDIVAKESDDLLQAEDEKLARAFEPQAKPNFRQKLREFARDCWQNPAKRRAIIFGGISLVLLLAVVPFSRYFFLNAVGVRARASLTVLDESTQQPLKNVRVQLAGQSGQTDEEGRVHIERLKLGRHELVVEKRAFAEIKRTITIGWGSNPLGDTRLTPIGLQYSFITTDFLSGKPVEKAEAISGEASAVADEKGKIVLTVDKDSPEDTAITIKADNYREEQLPQSAEGEAPRSVKMVAARPHVFVSKRSGKYDVYRVDADGKNESVVLPGTGSEQDGMVLTPHPKQSVVAVISSRGNQRNQDGFLLNSLTIIDMAAKKPIVKDVTTSERIEPIGWFDDRLAYMQVAAGASANNPRRYLLLSYDYMTGDRKELASGNYFNDVLAVGDQIYYAPAFAYDSQQSRGFYRVHADGSGKETVLDKEVWNIFRSGYQQLNLSLNQEWYELRLGESKAQKAKGPPADLRDRTYVDSPNGEQSLWIDGRDGKGVLLARNLSDDKPFDKVIKSQSGLTFPLQWLNDSTIVYRIQTDQETADYAVSVDGGDPVKIRDVTSTGSANQRYH